MALHWSEECQRAFEDLKQAVIDDPVLQLPDHTKPFEVHTDASDYVIGGMLVQQGNPVAYESRKLNETERRGPGEGDDSNSALLENVEAGHDLWSRRIMWRRVTSWPRRNSRQNRDDGKQDKLAKFEGIHFFFSSKTFLFSVCRSARAWHSLLAERKQSRGNSSLGEILWLRIEYRSMSFLFH